MTQKPSHFKPIGKPFKRMGVQLVAVARPEGLLPRDACRGCHFQDYCSHRLACSSFDRKDGQSVWFQKIETK